MYAKLVLDKYLDNAFHKLKQDNRLYTLGILLNFKAEKILEPVFIKMENYFESEKVSASYLLGALSNIRKVDAVLLRVKGNFRKFNKPEERKFFLENIDTEHPSYYPERLQDKFISISYFDTKTQKVDSVFCDYKIVDGKIKSGEPSYMADWDNPFVKNIVNGWKSVQRVKK